MTALSSPTRPALAPVLSKVADLVAELAQLHAVDMASGDAAEFMACLNRLAEAEPRRRAVPRPVALKAVPEPNRSPVLVVDDRPLLVQGIRRVLESTPDFYLAGHSASLRAAADDVRALAPQIVLLTPRTGGELATLELCRRIHLDAPQAKVILVGDGANRAALTACQKGPVHGVIPLGCTEAELVSSLRHALAADEPSRSTPDLDIQPADPEPYAAVYERLRPREHDVLRLLAAGAATADVAARLGITTNTVRSYTQSLMAKLQAHNRVQLLLTARSLGLL